tara:strand:+ start:6087 stop:6347 length:261 start_codon:yes stop_codon:yes gene_type:complete
METKNSQEKQGGKVLKGTVVKSAAQDTITVAVTRYVAHPKYKKFQKRTKKFLVHNPGNTAEVGDIVSIKESKPISKNKRFILVTND